MGKRFRLSIFSQWSVHRNSQSNKSGTHFVVSKKSWSNGSLNTWQRFAISNFSQLIMLVFKPIIGIFSIVICPRTAYIFITREGERHLIILSILQEKTCNNRAQTYCTYQTFQSHHWRWHCCLDSGLATWLILRQWLGLKAVELPYLKLRRGILRWRIKRNNISVVHVVYSC